MLWGDVWGYVERFFVGVGKLRGVFWRGKTDKTHKNKDKFKFCFLRGGGVVVCSYVMFCCHTSAPRGWRLQRVEQAVVMNTEKLEQAEPAMLYNSL